jgi:hypothetical protein
MTGRRFSGGLLASRHQIASTRAKEAAIPCRKTSEFQTKTLI